MRLPHPVTMSAMFGKDDSFTTRISPREKEVLALIAAGQTDRQIADALVISELTAARHAHNILEKLQLSSRTEAAAWWEEHGGNP